MGKPKPKIVGGIVTLSVYGPTSPGFGHRTTGRASPTDQISVAESLSVFSEMLEAFRETPLGTKLYVTMQIDDDPDDTIDESLGDA